MDICGHALNVSVRLIGNNRVEPREIPDSQIPTRLELARAGFEPARLPAVIVRDGYTGYQHLTGAVHAWCGAHLDS